MQPLLVQQSSNAFTPSSQLCEGSSIQLKSMGGKGYWSVSDSTIASLHQHTLMGKISVLHREMRVEAMVKIKNKIKIE